MGEKTSDTVTLNYSVPQGSVLGPQWFVIYTSSLRHIIHKHGLDHAVYADDSQLYWSFDPNQEDANKCVLRIEACVEDIRKWMKQNCLKLNDNKTEVMLIGSKPQLNKVIIPHMKIGDSTTALVSKVRNLGVFMANAMTLVPHISSVIICFISAQEPWQNS